MFHDARIPVPQAAQLHALFVKHAVNPPDDATVERWAAESHRELRERYGPAEAERRLATARAFVASRPELQQLLNATGVGSLPEVVLALAESPTRCG